MLVPDVALHLPSPTRVRVLARGGPLVLVTGSPGATRSLEDALQGATLAPVRVIGVDAADPDGGVRAALGASAGEAWVLRPDAHVAAVVPAADPAAVVVAVLRAIGAASPEPVRGLKEP